MSAITVGELYTWAFRGNAPPKRLEMLEELLRDLMVLDVAADVAREFGQLRARLLDTGMRPGDMDLLIAATAMVHDLSLVTHNTRDFAHVPQLRLLDWTVP